MLQNEKRYSLLLLLLFLYLYFGTCWPIVCSELLVFVIYLYLVEVVRTGIECRRKGWAKGGTEVKMDEWQEDTERKDGRKEGRKEKRTKEKTKVIRTLKQTWGMLYFSTTHTSLFLQSKEYNCGKERKHMCHKGPRFTGGNWMMPRQQHIMVQKLR